MFPQAPPRPGKALVGARRVHGIQAPGRDELQGRSGPAIPDLPPEGVEPRQGNGDFAARKEPPAEHPNELSDGIELPGGRHFKQQKENIRPLPGGVWTFCSIGGSGPPDRTLREDLQLIPAPNAPPLFPVSPRPRENSSFR